jgi:hypothetical protein
MTSLFVAIISISFAHPAALSLCKDTDCNLLYMPTTVRVTSCNCSETVHSFSYSNGYDNLYVNYSVTSPISHDFYQERTLVGSCPKGLLCTHYMNLDPTKELTTIIREQVDDKKSKPVLYSTDSYELFFDTV